MTWRSLTFALLAGAGWLAWTASVHAQDTVRLKLTPSNDAPTITLRSTGDEADITEVHGGGHGGHGGFHGSVGHYYGGYHGGYGYARYGYARYGYARYGYGYYGGIGIGYSAYYYPAPVYYYSSPVYYSTPSYYYGTQPVYPIGDSTLVTPSVNLRVGPDSGLETIPPPRAQPQDGPRTFPYDGGPRVPVPMPKPVPETTTTPPPVSDRAVSLPARGAPRLAYPAYGEKPR